MLFCVGRHDLVTPPELAGRLLEHIAAPHKRLVVFEHEAHCLHYEAPEVFARVVLSWLATTQTPSSEPRPQACSQAVSQVYGS